MVCMVRRVNFLTWFGVLQNFLLFKNEADDWEKVLRHGRDDYAKRRDNFLKYIKHPEALANLAVDPLADEPNVSLLFAQMHCPSALCS